MNPGQHIIDFSFPLLQLTMSASCMQQDENFSGTTQAQRRNHSAQLFMLFKHSTCTLCCIYSGCINREIPLLLSDERQFLTLFSVHLVTWCTIHTHLNSAGIKSPTLTHTFSLHALELHNLSHTDTQTHTHKNTLYKAVCHLSVTHLHHKNLKVIKYVYV